MATWVPYREEYLEELMRSEGRGDHPNLCGGCANVEPLYRCKDCVSGAMWCHTCIKFRHNQSPLHVIEVSLMSISFKLPFTYQAFISPGTAHSSRLKVFKNSGYDYNLVTRPINAARALKPLICISLLSTRTESTVLRWISAGAPAFRIVNNSYV